MSRGDAEGLTRVRRRASHILDRVAAVLPTVRARLFALVLVALVPALVILVYDAWLARERGFAALTDLSTRVVGLLQREMEDRVARGAHRLSVLATDPDVIARTPAATRKLVGALREDQLYNNLSIADGSTGEILTSAVPLERATNVRERLAFQRARRTLNFATGAFLPDAATGESGLNLAQPAIDDTGVLRSVVCASIDLDWVSGFIDRAGLPADMQMPELDGLAATRVLRADHRFASLPIIALTANAMKVDLDACLAAGMNDHITKPIDRRKLVATLRRWLPRPTADGAAPAPETVPIPPVERSGDPSTDETPPLDGVDVAGTLRRLEIDRATLDRMLLRFADGQREMLHALRQAVVAGDAQMAARHAHAITGAAGNLGADELRAAARALEQAGRDDRGDLTDLLAAVEARAAVVLKSIETLRPPATPEAPPPTGPFDAALTGAALDRLTAALDDCDTTSVSRALNEVDGSGLPVWAADDLERLHRHVDGYEYGEARGIASRLLSKVQNQAS